MDKSLPFNVVHQSLQWLERHANRQPGLGELAEHTGYSPYHIQRMFLQWAGVSPKEFLQALTREAAVTRLMLGEAALDCSIDLGLSGPSRLYDLTVKTDSLTPGQIRRGAAGTTIFYGTALAPFGPALYAWNPRGLCFLGFCADLGEEQTLQELQAQWHGADFISRPAEAADWNRRVFENPRRQPLPVWLRGSPFQLRVWLALLAIPSGAHATYAQIAQAVDHPRAHRAVGTAIGSNPLAWIIPCHRVIRKMGELGGYRWGAPMKSLLVGREAAVAAVGGAA